MRFTIKLKLALAFGAIILLSAGAGWIAVSNLAGINDGMKTLLSGPVARQNKIAEVQSTFLNLLRKDKNLLLTSDPEEIKKYEEIIREDRKDISAKVDDLAKLISEESRDKLERVRAAISKYILIEDKIIEFGRHDTNAEAYELSEKEANKAFEDAWRL
jgi:methyl-accepting chemotaxis protein